MCRVACHALDVAVRVRSLIGAVSRIMCVCEDARVSADERVTVLGEGLLATMNVESAMLLIADCDVNVNFWNEPLCQSAMVASTKFSGSALNGPSADLFFSRRRRWRITDMRDWII